MTIENINLNNNKIQLITTLIKDSSETSSHNKKMKI